ncbi:hypothetical protein [Thiobacillus denitrificans]|uniref:hypothetical protein n=1 Tax=Thiobacillus denitrificans TaxID=36861 RepID=UPI00075AF28D|nr:hypothetical protein [Thiobacillus denitrificans]
MNVITTELGTITAELERTAYCAQTVDSFRAYAEALEEELDDLGEQAAECARMDAENDKLNARIETLETEYTDSMADMEMRIYDLETQLNAGTPSPSGESTQPTDSGEAAPAPAGAINCDTFRVVAVCPIWGDVLEIPDVAGGLARVARRQLENPARAILATYTKTGKKKPGNGINRANLLIDGAELTPAAAIESALKSHGWHVARYPRSAEQRAKLAGLGFDAYIQTAPGQFEPHPLGLVWAKPSQCVGEAAPQAVAVVASDVAAWLDPAGTLQAAGLMAVQASGEQTERTTSGEAGEVMASGEQTQPDVLTVEVKTRSGDSVRVLAKIPAWSRKRGESKAYPLTYGSMGVAEARAAKLRKAGIVASVYGSHIQIDPSGEVPAEPACATLIPGRWIPGGAENAERIAFDTALGAEVWLIASTRQPGSVAVIAYSGKRGKHDAHYTMRDRAQAMQWAGEYMDKQQAQAQRKTERRAEQTAKRAAGHKLQVGDVLRSSWGYDQTNIDYYEVTKLIGARMVELREIGAESVGGDHYMTGDCVPKPGHYTGEAKRHMVCDDGQSVKVRSFAWANKIEPRDVAGLKCYPVDHWTAYA